MAQPTEKTGLIRGLLPRLPAGMRGALYSTGICDAKKGVQQYCGPHCCRDIEETRRKLKWAVDVLLCPLPQIFPQKSWAGQAKAASHVFLLMILHDALAENWSSAQARRVELASFVGEVHYTPCQATARSDREVGTGSTDRSTRWSMLGRSFFAAVTPGTVAFARPPTPV